MLKFARSRSSSSDRSSFGKSVAAAAAAASAQGQSVNLQKTVTGKLFCSEEAPITTTPKSTSRSSSLERPRSRRQLSFERDLTPRELRLRRRLPTMRTVAPPSSSSSPSSSTSSSPPPLPPPMKLTNVKLPMPSPTLSDSSSTSSSDYEQLSSGKLCRRQQQQATLAPLTPTLEKLAASAVSGKSRSCAASPPPPRPKSVLKRGNRYYDFHRDVERLVAKLDLPILDTSSESGYGSDGGGSGSQQAAVASTGSTSPPPLPRRQRKRRVRFDSYVLLLQGLRERCLDTVCRHVSEVCSAALATDEVVTGFLCAVAEGRHDMVQVLLDAGVDANAGSGATGGSAGLTPLHVAAAVNSLPTVELLLARGATVFARAHSSGRTPAQMAASPACHAYLRCMEECLGVANSGRVFAAASYRTCRPDELCLSPGDRLTVLRRGDYPDSAWWWCQTDSERASDQPREGYVLKDLLCLHKRT